jgi:serine/threonine protein kinase
MEKAGRYRIIGELGRGGMGSVYEAEDPIIGRTVALKLIRLGDAGGPDGTPALQKLYREAQAAGQLSHPNIVTIYDAGEISGGVYIAMELVDGPRLDQVMTAHATGGEGISRQRLLPILREAASALDYAHAMGIVHRDIKPSNIMSTRRGITKITDFGIAKPVREDLTRAGEVAGTPSYMSPQQIQGEAVDGRSDQFSLAIVAYELLSGVKPFIAETLTTLLYRVVNEELPEPRAWEGLNSNALKVLRRAAAKSPNARYPDCTVFVNDLEDALCRTTPQYAARKRSGAPGGIVAPETPRAATKDTPDAAISRRSRFMEPIRTRRAVIVIAAVALLALTVYGFHWTGSAPPPARSESDSVEAPPIGIPRQIDQELFLPSGNMVLIKEGEAMLGRDPRSVQLPAFYMDRTEVSNGAYRDFCQATSHALPPGLADAEAGDPVVNVTFEDAAAFASWAGKRLPAAREWERAARGPRRQAFPWGDDVRLDAANIWPDEASARRAKVAFVSSYSQGASPEGVLNLIGDVWELVGDHVVPDEQEWIYLKTEYRFLNPPLGQNEPIYQIRGGSYGFAVSADRMNALVWDHGLMPARARRQQVGFRCARDVAP